MKPIIKQYQSGLTSVLFNTRDKWMEYSVYYGGNTDGGNLTIYLDTFEGNNIVSRYESELPASCNKCIKYVHQEKDQIEVLFVPRNMLTT